MRQLASTEQFASLKRMLVALACAIGPCLAGSGGAEAHPHVWIEARAVIVYEAGRPVAVRNSWTFDPAYSAFLTLGAARDASGNVPDGSLDASAAKAVASVADSDYFTEVRGQAGRKANGSPSHPSLVVRGDRATLAFDLPVSDRHGPTGELEAGKARLEVMDPSYFVSFTFAEGDSVRLEGAPEGCKVDLRRPKGFSVEDARVLATDVLSALNVGDVMERIGNVAAVSCPAP